MTIKWKKIGNEGVSYTPDGPAGNTRFYIKKIKSKFSLFEISQGKQDVELEVGTLKACKDYAETIVNNDFIYNHDETMEDEVVPPLNEGNATRHGIPQDVLNGMDHTTLQWEETGGLVVDMHPPKMPKAYIESMAKTLAKFGPTLSNARKALHQLWEDSGKGACRALRKAFRRLGLNRLAAAKNYQELARWWLNRIYRDSSKSIRREIFSRHGYIEEAEHQDGYGYWQQFFREDPDKKLLHFLVEDINIYLRELAAC